MNYLSTNIVKQNKVIAITVATLYYIPISIIIILGIISFILSLIIILG